MTDPPSVVLLRELLRRGFWLEDDGGRLLVGPRDRLNETLRAAIRRHRDELLAEIRDRDAPVRRSVLAAAEGLGWPRVAIRPATEVGGSEALWTAFARGARSRDLTLAFHALELYEEELSRAEVLG